MKVNAPPPVSVIIVTYHSTSYLQRCLLCLSKQTFRDFEIIVVDNGSRDDVLSCLQGPCSGLNVQIKYLGENKGFAFANNIGARMARGDWIATLNADAFPEPDWLEQLLRASALHPNAFFASRQLQALSPSLLDGEGDVYHVSGLAWRRNYGTPAFPKNELEEVFSPCAAAALYPRRAFLEVGGFDEDFFAYHEDVDLGFRMRLKGLQCFYVPKAIVYHVGSASTGKLSEFVVYHGHRNLVWTFVKNMPSSLLWAYLPLHLLMNAYYLLSFAAKGYGKVIWKAKKDAFLGLRPMLAKRKEIQSNRCISPCEIHRYMERGLLAPFLEKSQRSGINRS